MRHLYTSHFYSTLLKRLDRFIPLKGSLIIIIGLPMWLFVFLLACALFLFTMASTIFYRYILILPIFFFAYSFRHFYILRPILGLFGLLWVVLSSIIGVFTVISTKEGVTLAILHYSNFLKSFPNCSFSDFKMEAV